jgi:hypothetical protein
VTQNFIGVKIPDRLPCLRTSYPPTSFIVKEFKQRNNTYLYAKPTIIGVVIK